MFYGTVSGGRGPSRANSVDLVSKLIGFGALPVCFIVPSQKPLCVIGVAGLALFLALDAGAMKKLAEDPPDANYTEIVSPIFVSPPQLIAQGGIPQSEADAFNALATNLSRAVALERAIYTTINRSTGALDAGEAFWNTKQLEALSAFEAQLAAVVGEQISLRRALQLALAVAGVPNLAITSAGAIQFQQSLANSGFPAEWRAAAQQLGVDNTEIASVTQSIIAQDASQITGSFPASLADPALDSSSLQAAQALRDASQSNGVVIPCAKDVSAQVTVAPGGYRLNQTSGRFAQVVTLTNRSNSTIAGTLSLVLDNLTSNASLFNKNGSTSCAAPLGNYVDMNLVPTGRLAPGASTSITLEFLNPTRQSIQYSPRILAGAALR